MSRKPTFYAKPPGGEGAKNASLTVSTVILALMTPRAGYRSGRRHRALEFGVRHAGIEREGGAMSTKKYVYLFAAGKAEGQGAWRNLLGGKGAGLAEMTNLGIPVPPGFTITT
jgi:hypothetical protein